MLRAGLLLPRSTFYPSLGIDFFNGLKELLKYKQIKDDFLLTTDNIGFGVNEQEIYTKAEKMILQDDVDLVILFADVMITELLQPLFSATNKILLTVNFGANFPENWTPGTTAITHTLNFCWHTSLTGELAAKETNKQAVNIVSYYDGGYRQCFCMLNAHQVNGGIPVYNHITNIRTEQFTLDPVLSALKENTDVSTLLCLFSGDQAERFYAEVTRNTELSRLNIYVSPMMLDEQLNLSAGKTESVCHVKGYIPWHSSLKNEANISFQKHYNENTGNKANYFSLLGWESGLLLHEIKKQHDTGNTNAANIIVALTNIVVESPRGRIKTDTETHYTYGPAYLAERSKLSDIKIVEELNGADGSWQKFTKTKLSSGETSNWRNTYLCI